MQGKKGDWVRISNIVLEAGKRSSNLPEDTKKVPLEMWTKGFLLDEKANIGDRVNIESYIGRRTQGELVEINPSYDHNFGKCIPEVLYIGKQVRDLLGEVD